MGLDARSLILACLVVTIASPSVARDRPASTAASTQARDATTLATLIYPEGLNRAIITYTIERVVTPTYHADPELRSLEAEHPGVIDAMIAAMRPELERSGVEEMPRLWAKTSAVYAEGLSPRRFGRRLPSTAARRGGG